MVWDDGAGPARSVSGSNSVSVNESGMGISRLWATGTGGATSTSWSNRIRMPSSRRLTYTEKLTMSPLAKFRKYGRFPFKLMFHLTVVVLSTTFILLHDYEFSAFMSANERSFRDALQHDPNPDPEGNTIIFSVDDLVTHLKTGSVEYFKYHNHTIGEVTTQPSVDMRLDFWNGTTTNTAVTADRPLGPLNATRSDEPLRDVVDSLQYITITYPFQNTLYELEDNAYGPFQTVDFDWTCTGLYDFSDDAETVFHLKIASRLSGNQYITKLIVIDGVTVMLCLLSSLLSCRALHKSHDVYLYARRRLRDPDPQINGGGSGLLTWSGLTSQDHLAFFNLWHVVTIIGDIFLIIGCCLGMSKQFRQTETAHHFLTAEQMFRSLGIFLEWFSLVKYMEFDLEFYMLVVAVRASLTRVFKFVIMTMPMYLGYTFIGLHCFSSHADLFGSLTDSARTLFALLNGDSILLVYQELCTVDDAWYCVFSQIYLYTFCIIFIVVVLNVFIFIIETGYEKAQMATTPHDEHPVILDHNRLRRILDAADRAAGIDLRQLGADGTHGDDSDDADDDDLPLLDDHSLSDCPGSNGSRDSAAPADAAVHDSAHDSSQPSYASSPLPKGAAGAKGGDKRTARSMSETTLSLTGGDIERMIERAVDRAASRFAGGGGGGGGGTRPSADSSIYEDSAAVGGDAGARLSTQRDGATSPSALQRAAEVNKQLNEKLRATAGRLVQVEETGVTLRDALQREFTEEMQRLTQLNGAVQRKWLDAKASAEARAAEVVTLRRQLAEAMAASTDADESARPS